MKRISLVLILLLSQSPSEAQLSAEADSLEKRAKRFNQWIWPSLATGIAMVAFSLEWCGKGYSEAKIRDKNMLYDFKYIRCVPDTGNTWRL